MLEVRENEIALRKLSGGTAQLRTLEGTLMMNYFLLWNIFQTSRVNTR